MPDTSRLRIVVQVGCRLLVFFLVLNLVLATLSAFVPGWLPKRFFGVDFVKENRFRALAAQAHYREGLVDRNKPLVAILGLSSASEGIVLRDLTTIHEDQTLFLGLAGAGRNIEDVARYAEPLLSTDLRPDLVVFAISPFHLVDGYVSDFNPIEMFGLWFWVHRGDLRHVFDLNVLAARSRLFQYFDVHSDETLGDPWNEMVRLGLPENVSEGELVGKIAQYGRRGYYDPVTYANSQDQVETLVSLIRQFRSRHSRVLVALMPEHSALREQVPVEGFNMLTEALTRAHDGGALPLLDFRDAVSDDGFMDISHMNGEGRTRFSPVLAQAIGEHLPRSTKLRPFAALPTS